jgi:hypothetical protein
MVRSLVLTPPFFCVWRLTDLLGLWIKKWFDFPESSFTSCTLSGRHGREPIQEMTHRCLARHMLYEDLVSLVPNCTPVENNCWFRTTNAELNVSSRCLFEGAKLEFNVSLVQCPEFGFCFRRTSFAAEREAFDVETVIGNLNKTTDPGEWIRREPSDSDRLRVNKKGREVLYFFQSPSHEPDLSFGDLRSEICRSLQIVDSRRVSLAAGPFLWGPDFQDDGLPIYGTYFKMDIVVDGRHMKTAQGAALIDVIECTVDALR